MLWLLELNLFALITVLLMQHRIQQRLQQQHAHQRYRQRPLLTGPQSAQTTLGQQAVVNFSANDYLGLANHPKVKSMNNDLNAQWMQRDLAVLWHPCTQMKDHECIPLIPIQRAQGLYLEDFNGNRYLDAISSWWTTLFGHCHPYINERIKTQVDTLEHVMLAGFSHQPVIELSERLVHITPTGLNRVFYADNGSSNIEVALKMSLHYWRNQGQSQKTRFATITNGYHGETIGTMSVGDIPLYTDTYKALLFDSIKVPTPDCYWREAGQSWEDYSCHMFTHMEKALAEHHHHIAAVILEPLVQGAAGMRMYHPHPRFHGAFQRAYRWLLAFSSRTYHRHRLRSVL